MLIVSYAVKIIFSKYFSKKILVLSRAVTVTVTTASPAVVGCHRGCLLPPAVVHVTSHTL